MTDFIAVTRRVTASVRSRTGFTSSLRTSYSAYVLCGLASLVPVTLWAQVCTTSNVTSTASCSQGLVATRTVGSVISVVLSTVTLTLPTPTSADFDAGYVQATAPSITVYANTPWTLNIDSPAAVWPATATGSEPVRATKPVGDLSWSGTPSGAYAPLTTNSTQVILTGSATSGTNVRLYLRAALDWTQDTPGNYSITVRLTLTAP